MDKPVLCPVCHNEQATSHPTFGLLPGAECKKRQSQLPKVGSLPEFTSDSIKHQRKEFAKDIIQPFRKGQLSKEYVEAWGTKRLTGITPKEIKNAKNVWDSETYYKR